MYLCHKFNEYENSENSENVKNLLVVFRGAGVRKSKFLLK